MRECVCVERGAYIYYTCTWNCQPPLLTEDHTICSHSYCVALAATGPSHERHCGGGGRGGEGMRIGGGRGADNVQREPAAGHPQYTQPSRQAQVHLLLFQSTNNSSTPANLYLSFSINPPPPPPYRPYPLGPAMAVSPRAISQHCTTSELLAGQREF